MARNTARVVRWTLISTAILAVGALALGIGYVLGQREERPLNWLEVADALPHSSALLEDERVNPDDLELSQVDRARFDGLVIMLNAECGAGHARSAAPRRRSVDHAIDELARCVTTHGVDD